MQLHDLRPRHTLKNPRTRVGRGGKRGTTSGRGTKGQKSRAGHRIRPAERDFMQRLPKLRGFKNRSTDPKTQIVNLEAILRVMPGKIVNLKNLAEAKLINWPSKRPVKILGHGAIHDSMTIEKIAISKSARKKVEAAQGKIID